MWGLGQSPKISQKFAIFAISLVKRKKEILMLCKFDKFVICVDFANFPYLKNIN